MPFVIKRIFVHCSASEFGDASVIDQWHKERGWDGIGYHYVILNGCRSKGEYHKGDDGKIEPGRPLDKQGAHCKGENADSLGVCLIGVRHFSPEQLYTSVPFILRQLMKEYNLTADDVYGHYEFTSEKSCPNINMETLRVALRGRI